MDNAMVSLFLSMADQYEATLIDKMREFAAMGDDAILAVSELFMSRIKEWPVDVMRDIVEGARNNERPEVQKQAWATAQMIAACASYGFARCYALMMEQKNANPTPTEGGPRA